MLATSLGAVFKLMGVGIQVPFSWFQERAKSEAGAMPIQGPFLQWFSTCGLPLLWGVKRPFHRAHPQLSENTDTSIVIHSSSKDVVMKQP